MKISGINLLNSNSNEALDEAATFRKLVRMFGRGEADFELVAESADILLGIAMEASANVSRARRELENKARRSVLTLVKG